MRNIQTVLAATDFSDCARTALDAAGNAANMYKARLVVAHVLQNLDQTYRLFVDDVLKQRLLEEEQAEAEATLEQALDELRVSRSRTDSVVTRGSPVDALIRIGLREHADLLVAGLMGSACGADEATLGTVVDRLLRCGLFDLYLVRKDETPGIQKVAVATDFSDSSDVAVQRAVDLAVKSGIDHVTLIHAFELPQGYSKLNLGEAEAERHVRQNVQRLYEELEARLPPPQGVRYEPRFVRGVDHAAIRDACVTEGVDMLVIGATGRTAAAVALIGNVALKIVKDAPCSVWVSRPAGQTLTIVDALKRLMGLAD